MAVEAYSAFRELINCLAMCMNHDLGINGWETRGFANKILKCERCNMIIGKRSNLDKKSPCEYYTQGS